jgi:hypothetical protein
MTSVLSTKTVRHGALTRKRGLSNDATFEQDQPRRKTARKDSLSQAKDATPSYQRELDVASKKTPLTQNALLLHGKRLPYTLAPSHNVPQIKQGKDELLIKVQTIGLNPIDWKAPDYGFAIPVLPYIAGRDFVGVVICSNDPEKLNSSERIKSGDVVLTASTDYRDLRKAAYQEYSVASRFNLCRIPYNFNKDNLSSHERPKAGEWITIWGG